VLRQLERWLHQHIFKVGWLITKNFYTTTILYYTFFLPGIFVYEITYWITAGILDVRAERSISMPEKQEVGELHLNFVKLAKRAGSAKTRLIALSPLLTGLALLWVISSAKFDFQSTLDMVSVGTLEAFGDAIRNLTSTTDFWLWAYLLFAISNTMFPEKEAFKGVQWIAGAAIVVAIPFFFLGLGDQVVGGAITGPIADGLNLLSTIFVAVILFDVIAVGILALIENTIEYVTGDSATFRNGKMVVMTRQEAIAQRKQERRRQRSKQQRTTASTMTGQPSVYRFEFPMPGSPGSEPVTQRPSAIVEPEAKPSLPRFGNRPIRNEPNLITAEANKITEENTNDTVESSSKTNVPSQSRQFESGQSNTRKDATTTDLVPDLSQSRSPFSQSPLRNQSATNEEEDDEALHDTNRREISPNQPGSGLTQFGSQEQNKPVSQRSDTRAPLQRPSGLSARLSSQTTTETQDDGEADENQPEHRMARASISGNPLRSSTRGATRSLLTEDDDDFDDDEEVTYEDFDDPD
jgi:hypothetical protein